MGSYTFKTTVNVLEMPTPMEGFLCLLLRLDVKFPNFISGGPIPTRRSQPPILPPAPTNLSSAQLKRRHIISSLVLSENNYVASLQRLVNDYKKPLEESNPPILSSSKVSILFHRVPEILQCHTVFR